MSIGMFILVCALVFLVGQILWKVGLAASAFSILGHYVGADMVMNNGVKVIKPIIIVVLILLIIKIITGI